MKHLRNRCYALMLLLLLAAGSMALPTQSYAQKKKKSAKYEEKTYMSFEGSVIEGRVMKPDGFFLLRQRGEELDDLLKVRKDYKDELNNMKYDF